MGAILDYIASVVIFGVLLMTVARVQINLQATLGQSTHSLMTQRNGVELARQIEFDFLKIGHRVKGPKILAADTNRISFRADIDNDFDTTLVTYQAGTTLQAAYSNNPDDFPLFRTAKGTMVQQNFGLTYFKIFYYDSVFTPMTTPITVADSLRKIRSLKIRFIVTSADPSTDGIDTVWSTIMWEKLMIPRNLTKLDL